MRQISVWMRPVHRSVFSLILLAGVYLGFSPFSHFSYAEENLVKEAIAAGKKLEDFTTEELRYYLDHFELSKVQKEKIRSILVPKLIENLRRRDAFQQNLREVLDFFPARANVSSGIDQPIIEILLAKRPGETLSETLERLVIEVAPVLMKNDTGKALQLRKLLANEISKILVINRQQGLGPNAAAIVAWRLIGRLTFPGNNRFYQKQVEAIWHDPLARFTFLASDPIRYVAFELPKAVADRFRSETERFGISHPVEIVHRALPGEVIAMEPVAFSTVVSRSDIAAAESARLVRLYLALDETTSLLSRLLNEPTADLTKPWGDLIQTISWVEKYGIGQSSKKWISVSEVEALRKRIDGESGERRAVLVEKLIALEAQRLRTELARGDGEKTGLLEEVVRFSELIRRSLHQLRAIRPKEKRTLEVGTRRYQNVSVVMADGSIGTARIPVGRMVRHATVSRRLRAAGHIIDSQIQEHGQVSKWVAILADVEKTLVDQTEGRSRIGKPEFAQILGSIKFVREEIDSSYAIDKSLSKSVLDVLLGLENWIQDADFESAAKVVRNAITLLDRDGRLRSIFSVIPFERGQQTKTQNDFMILDRTLSKLQEKVSAFERTPVGRTDVRADQILEIHSLVREYLAMTSLPENTLPSDWQLSNSAASRIAAEWKDTLLRLKP